MDRYFQLYIDIHEGNGKSSDIELELKHGIVETGICYSLLDVS